MTPEDTFQALRRLPFDDLQRKIAHMSSAEVGMLSLHDDLRIEWLASHGWEESDFEEAVKAKLGK